MDFVLTKVYAKLYICQLLNAVSYPEWTRRQNEYDQLLNEHFHVQTTQVIDNIPMAIDPIDENNQEMMIDNTSSQSKIPLVDEKDVKYRKFFVYKNIIYSKIEIQGIIVEVHTRGHTEHNNLRKILYVDDTTGIIQCIIWKNKTEALYSKTEQVRLCGKYIRILGQVDYYCAQFEIVIENFQLAKNFQTELLFHITLAKNQAAIAETQIFSQSFTGSIEQTPGEVKYSNLLREFANRLLAFFQNYRIDYAVDDEFGFTKIKVENLLQNCEFMEMLNDFCTDKIDKNKFLQDCFEKVLEQQMQGKLIPNIGQPFVNCEVEIKNDNTKIKNDITDLLTKRYEENPSNVKGVTYIEIMQQISILYNNFYTNDYLKFIIRKLIDDMVIYELSPNTYCKN